MAENKKHYIRVQGKLVEVTPEVYHVYYSTERHLLTLDEKDERNGKTLYSNLDTPEMLGEELLLDRDAISVEDAAIANILYQQLHRALAMLPKTERELIDALYFERLSERQISQRTGVHYMTIHSRKINILKKLRKLLGD